MQIIVKSNTAIPASTPLLIVLADKTTLTKSTNARDPIQKLAQQLYRSDDLKSSANASCPLLGNTQQFGSIKADRAYFVSVGNTDQLTTNQTNIAATVAKILKTTAAKSAVLVTTFDSKELPSVLGEIARASIYVRYSYQLTLSKPASIAACKKLIVCTSSKQENATRKAVKRGQGIGEGQNIARELGNLPANICTPSYLASEAKKLARQSDLLTTKVLGEKQMAELGMGSLLSVAAGSDEEAKLIVMHYNGAKNKKDAPKAIVGKGVTFDSGGISLKPGARMDEMKFDMCGAASVFGTVHALLKLKPAINVVAIVPATENMPNGIATKPGDVVTSMAGKTIEVLNTDAEGRLILCDALTYVESFKPTAVVDIATLTGACITALGHHRSALFSNDQKLADELTKAADASNDLVWQLPIDKAYKKQLKSNFADLANIGGAPAGSITAACFLAEFATNYAWAHLDIAGTAWAQGAAKGSTGRPVALLSEWLLGPA